MPDAPAPHLIDAYDFDLPEARIALRPAEPRDAARLLVVRPGDTKPLTDAIVRDLPDWLRPGMRSSSTIPA